MATKQTDLQLHKFCLLVQLINLVFLYHKLFNISHCYNYLMSNRYYSNKHHICLIYKSLLSCKLSLNCKLRANNNHFYSNSLNHSRYLVYIYHIKNFDKNLNKYKLNSKCMKLVDIYCFNMSSSSNHCFSDSNYKFYCHKICCRNYNQNCSCRKC